MWLLPLALSCTPGAGPAGDFADTGSLGDDTGAGADPDPWYCADAAPTVTEEGAGYRVTTDHYDLYLEGVSAAEAEEDGRMAEAAWLAWSAYFEAAPALDPGAHLKVEYLANEAAWEAAIAADGTAAPVGAGGYYWPPTETVYLWAQPTLYYNATLLLHEMTHQFHLLARTGNSARPAWYLEGAAEHLSRHDWDGRCLRLGRTPILSQEDFPALALAELGANGLDLPSILSGVSAPSRPIDRALWQYLDRGDGGRYHDGFRAFRDQVDADASVDAAAAFAADVGDPDTVAADLIAWEPQATEPMIPVFVDWVHEGPGHLRSVSSAMSVALDKTVPAELDATLAAGTGTWFGGVVVAWDGPSDFTTYLVGSDGSTSVFDVTAGVVDWMYVGTVEPAASYSFVATGTSVTVNGGPATTIATDHAAAVGLAAYASNLDFTAVGPL